MKNLVLLSFLMILSIAIGCTKKIQVKSDAAVLEVDNPLLFAETATPYVVVFIKRTSCFGTCPAYEAKMYSDGKVSYSGSSNVEKRGNFEAKIKKSEINKIVRKAFDIRYFLMEDQYPDPSIRVTDAPTTITSIVCTGQNKTIRNKLDAPAKLHDFETMIDSVFNKLHYTSIDPVK